MVEQQHNSTGSEAETTLPRMACESRTVRLMLELYCRDHHHPTSELCDDCSRLWDYVRERLMRCPFADEKPACSSCRIHCYKPAMREQIRVVMRYAGPRMVWRHPVLSAMHLLDARRSPSSGGPKGAP
jgi:hypothetical protein